MELWSGYLIHISIYLSIYIFYTFSHVLNLLLWNAILEFIYWKMCQPNQGLWFWTLWGSTGSATGVQGIWSVVMSHSVPAQLLWDLVLHPINTSDTFQIFVDRISMHSQVCKVTPLLSVDDVLRLTLSAGNLQLPLKWFTAQCEMWELELVWQKLVSSKRCLGSPVVIQP